MPPASLPTHVLAPSSQAGPLAVWYATEGRHQLPWRQTRDPWAVLVSEVMLQQTSVARVVHRWGRFLERWPSARACAGAQLAEVLREWDGLGYPRRAVRLWRAAALIAADGWPADEAGLCRLPGIGAYTARALLCLAFDRPGPPPRDVNLGRVSARAWLGVDEAPAGRLDAALRAHRPPEMSWRDYTLSLFDLGATVCQARRVECGRCPLSAACRSRSRLATGIEPRPRRQPAYAGSIRQLRGAVLRAMLADPELGHDELRRRVAAVPAAAEPGAPEAALAALRQEGILPAASLPRGRSGT